LNDPAQMHKRRLMMEQREKFEWQQRDREIEEIQKEKLEVNILKSHQFNPLSDNERATSS
jgi:hypothetical protein